MQTTVAKVPDTFCILFAVVDGDLVDYTMTVVSGLELPDVPEQDREPLPVKELVALRQTQLQCFRAMQLHQQQLQQQTAVSHSQKKGGEKGTSSAGGTGVPTGAVSSVSRLSMLSYGGDACPERRLGHVLSQCTS